MKKKVVCAVLVSMLLLSTMLLTGMQKVEAEGTAAVYVDPSFREVLINQTFSISISITNVTDLWFWEFKLWYTTANVNATNVTEGPFLKAGDAKTSFGIVEMNDAYNATHGLVWAGCMRSFWATGVNGSGILASVSFNATSLGSSDLLFACPEYPYPVTLEDPNLQTIACTATGGTIEVKSEIPPYGPKASFTVSPATLYARLPVTFNASASELGYNGTHIMPIAEYCWNFGDGATANETDPIATHTYTLAGNYTVTLTVYAPGATPETDTTTATIRLTSIATVFIDPSISHATSGQTFSINVTIANVTNLYGYEFMLYYNSNVLDGISVSLPPNHFLKPIDPSRIIVAKLETNDVYNATHGCVWFAVTLLDPEPPKSGSGTLATITLKATALGSSNLQLYYPNHTYPVKLAEPGYPAKPIPCTAVDGYVECVSLEHDVAVFLDVPRHLMPGGSTLLNVTVLNGGLNNETNVELQLLINGSIVNSTVISFLQVGSTYTLSYLWTTSTVEAIYNVTAYALPVSDEDYTTNNVKSARVPVSYIIRVPYHYQTIQEAIDAASPGTTIIVSAGTYYESLTIDKSLTLVGEEGSIPVIDGGGMGAVAVVHVTADNVEISKFTIENGLAGIFVGECNRVAISDNTITNNDYGIELIGCNNIVTGNTITNNSVNGIVLYEGFKNTINGNKMSENGWGIWATWSSYNVFEDNRITNNTNAGVYLDECYHNSFIGNTVSNNRWDGIVLWDSSSNKIEDNMITSNSFDGIILQGSNNTISGNTVSNNEDGVVLWWGEYNTIKDNKITNNRDTGIYLYGYDFLQPQCYNNSINSNTVSDNGIGIYVNHTENNTIYHNSFINNMEQTRLENSSDIWDNGCEGNYWSDYNGTDTNRDGIGDTLLPHQGVDNYPLMSPYIEGDVNHDAIVDIFDGVTIAVPFGAKPNDPNWNPHADLNEDGIIDIFDILMWAKHFGERWD